MEKRPPQFPIRRTCTPGYLYTAGLDGARAVVKVVREAVAADPKLGPDVALTIKRGCSEYEIELGPSDRYEFTPEMAELEAYLKARFEQPRKPENRALVLAQWIDLAYRLGAVLLNGREGDIKPTGTLSAVSWTRGRRVSRYGADAYGQAVRANRD